jgi:hypothetical protein
VAGAPIAIRGYRDGTSAVGSRRCVGGTHFEVEGDRDFAEVRDIEVLDVESGQTVRYDADPERWALNLPQAFRSGDLVCQVTGGEASAAAAREAMAARA